MNLGGEEIWGHTGLLPGYRSFLAYVPSIGASICVLVNQEDFAKPSIFVELLLATVKGFLVTALPIQAGKSEFNTFELHQNYPNPFNQATTFVFNLSIPSHVSIDVYNVHGRRVANVLNDHYVPGIHRINWEAQALASGLYLYRLTAGGFSLTQSLLLLR